MKLSLLLRASAIAVVAGLVPAASYAVPYNVNSMGTLVGTFSGNTPNGPDTFYKFNKSGLEEGTATSTFATVIGAGGTSATITWNGSQPLLDFLYLKAATYFVKWDISNFNDGVYDSITVANLGLITNRNNISQGISHVQIEGGLSQVPDGGATLALLGLALVGLVLVRRRAPAV